MYGRNLRIDITHVTRKSAGLIKEVTLTKMVYESPWPFEESGIIIIALST